MHSLARLDYGGSWQVLRIASELHPDLRWTRVEVEGLGSCDLVRARVQAVAAYLGLVDCVADGEGLLHVAGLAQHSTELRCLAVVGMFLAARCGSGIDLLGNHASEVA